MSEITPRPWFVHKRNGQELHILAEARKGIVSSICHISEGTMITLPQEANANHIVRCVNAHDDLVAALENIAEGAGRFSLDPLTHASNCVEDMQETARAALEKVRGAE